MADTTLNVRVVNNGTGGVVPPAPPVTPPNTPPSPQPPQQPIPPTNDRGNGLLPSNDRMIEDVRREMQQRGVLMVPGSSSMSQIINQYGANLRQSTQQSIKDEFTNKRKSLYAQRDEDIQLVEEEKRKFIKSKGLNPDDESDYEYARGYRRVADYEAKQRHIFHDYSERLDEVNKEEKSKRTDVDERLTNAIEELTKYFEREAGSGNENPNSYIGQLRAQQRALIQERDAATNEADARSASRRLAGVNEQLRDVMAGGPQGRPVYDSLFQGSQGIQNILSGVDNADPSSVIMGLGGAYAGFSGMGLKAALKFMGVVGLVAGATKFVTGGLSGAAGRLEGGRATLAGMLDDNPERLGADVINKDNQPGYRAKYNGSWNFGTHTAYYAPEDFGLSTEQFADKAIEVIRARGMGLNWREQVYLSMSNERAYGMNSGAILQGMKYDRYQDDRYYGTNKYLADLVSRLGTLQVDGIKINLNGQNDFTRVQEVFDIQQQIMGGYMSQADRPSYDAANRILEAFSSMKGITQDSRIGSDIGSFQEMIRNPMNDRMRALLYDVVQDIIPTYKGQSTLGRTDLIDQALHDPELEGKIIQQAITRVSAMFGGPDSQMGYWAFKQLLPGIAPDRMVAEVNAIKNEEDVRRLLRGEYWGDTRETAEKNMYANVDRAQGFTTGWTASIEGIKNDIHEIWDKICN